MKFDQKFWLKIALYNLVIVVILGVLMRYKIGYELPFLEQKNMLHAHSHFAFAGWITHAIYSLLAGYIISQVPQSNPLIYKRAIIINLISAYGSLLAFVIFGYNFLAISFLALALVNNCFVTYLVFKDLKNIQGNHPSVAWFKSAMFFNLFSSFGTMYLAYMIVTRSFNEYFYLSALYFYLHFQYNGFFTFSCIGLTIYKLPEFLPDYKYDHKIFIMFFASCFPAYFLSILWAKFPLWLYIIICIAAVVQVFAWVMFAIQIRVALKKKSLFTQTQKILFVFVATAITIKILLQLGSTIPVVSKLAFGFRPVVIAYLHLVLLGIISSFLLIYSYTIGIIQSGTRTLIALAVFLVGVFLNEAVLAIQGIASFLYYPIRHINDALFGVSLILLCGALLLVFSQRKRKALQQA